MSWALSFILVLGAAAVVPVVWAVVGLIRGQKRFWPVAAGAVWAGLLLAVTFIGMASNWGGCDAASEAGVIACGECAPDVWASQCGRESAGCAEIAADAFCPVDERPVFRFCEPFQGGAVQQPRATWSNLSFVAAGLWLLWWIQLRARGYTAPRDGAAVAAGPDNPMLAVGTLSIGYAMIVIFMGPASMWLHASMKAWGGWLDTMSVVIWLGFNAVYVVYALCFTLWGKGRGPARPIAILTVTTVLVLAFGVLLAMSPEVSLLGYFVAGGVWGVGEIVYVLVAAFAPGVVYRRTWWMLVVNLALLGVTMGLWSLFNDDVVSAQDCWAREGIPGHAIFHILASLSTVWTFMHFASERRLKTVPNSGTPDRSS